MNCWDHNKCKDEVRCSCPAFTSDRGDACWRVIGTKCSKEKVGHASLTGKFKVCKTCTFYTDILRVKANQANSA